MVVSEELGDEPCVSDDDAVVLELAVAPGDRVAVAAGVPLALTPTDVEAVAVDVPLGVEPVESEAVGAGVPLADAPEESVAEDVAVAVAEGDGEAPRESEALLLGGGGELVAVPVADTCVAEDEWLAPNDGDAVMAAVTDPVDDDEPV